MMVDDREGNIHPGSGLVSAGGSGVSDEHEAAVASPRAAVGTSERGASIFSLNGDLTGENVVDDKDSDSEVDQLMDDSKEGGEEIQKEIEEKQKALEVLVKAQEKRKESDGKGKKKSRKRAERKQAELDKEEEECAVWFQNHSKQYVPPAPKYLLVKDVGLPKYSCANVMKRTAWLGMALGMKYYM